MVRIKRKITSNGNHFGSGNQKRYITIHQTGNTSRGANAEMHSRYMNNGSPATWHYTVDDREVIQHLNHSISGWHSGDGRGDGNMNSIGIELCINSDGDYNKTLENGAELVKMLMKDENISLANVVQHNRWSGKDCPRQLRHRKNGIGWTEFKNMISGKKVEKVEVVEPSSNRSKNEIVQMVIDGEFGNNPERRDRLRKLGHNPDEIQRLVNERLTEGHKSQKTISQVAQEVIDGKWGNNPQRKQKLQEAGYNYDSVQEEVNRRANSSSATSKPSKPMLKSLDSVAKEVIDGKWGNNPERERRLRNAGYNPSTIQGLVNSIVSGRSKKSIGTIAQEVIDGKWGNNPQRRTRLERAGYDYNAIQREVNRRL